VQDCFDPLKTLGYVRSSDTVSVQDTVENSHGINSRSLVPVPRGAYRKIMVKNIICIFTFSHMTSYLMIVELFILLSFFFKFGSCVIILQPFTRNFQFN
jgi:hypothetical protein